MCDVCGAGVCECVDSEGSGRPESGSGAAAPQPQAAQILSKEASVLPTSSVWQGLDWGYSWSGKAVSYGFARGAGDYASGYYSSYNEPSKFLSLSAAGQDIVRSAFAVWDAVAAITLYEAASGVHPLINVGGSSIPSTSWAYSPGSYDSSGDVWFGVDKPFMSRLVSGKGPHVGSYEYATALHEIGHALGLKHPHQGSPTVPTQYDGLEYTVMSYRSYVGGPVSYYTVETWGYPQSLMMLDIAEIQAIYGADYGTLSGNTTYRFDPATGEMTVNGVSAGQPGANRVFRTLWDGGGTDHIDLSNYRTDVEIDLTPGRGVDLDIGGFAQRALLGTDSNGDSVYAPRHVYMSLLYQNDTRSLIENATGGVGDDILIGNQADNLLVGGAGDDTVTGGAGSDRFTLGRGHDTVRDTLAGLDGDTVTDFDMAEDRIVVRGVSLAANQVSYDAATDTLAIDTDRDGTPEAVLHLSLGTAQPLITLTGVSGGTEITFGIGSTSSNGSTGSGTGSTTGTAGTSSGGSATTVLLTAGADTYTDMSGADLIVSGRGGDDRITTGSGDDTLWGGPGNDILDAGAGNDTLISGAGVKDVLTGGAGADRFVIDSGDFTAGTLGKCFIMDFAPGTDMLVFTGFAATSLQDFAPRDTSSGLCLTVAARNNVFLQNVTVADLNKIGASFSSGPIGPAPSAPPQPSGAAGDPAGAAPAGSAPEAVQPEPDAVSGGAAWHAAIEQEALHAALGGDEAHAALHGAAHALGSALAADVFDFA